jgi:endoglucanase
MGSGNKSNTNHLFEVIRKRLDWIIMAGLILFLVGCQEQVSVPIVTETKAVIFQVQTTGTPTVNLPQPAATSESEEVESMEIFEVNARLGRGVNLGNALEAPQEGDWGVTLEARYFQLIAERGFDSIRIPIRWSAHASLVPPYNIDPAFFERVDWAINNAFEQDLAVVINFHHYEEIFGDPQGQEERFLAMWRQVADHYKTEPAELVFEILNEPHDQLDAKRWNQLLVKALAVIRETNPSRVVVIGPVEWNSIDALNSLELPEDDPNIIVTIHYYLPF